MDEETLADRIQKATAGMSEGELMRTLELSSGAVSRLRHGGIRSIKLGPAVRLARKRGISIYWLAGVSEPVHDIDVEIDGVRLALYAPATNIGQEGKTARAARRRLVEELKNAGFDATLHQGIGEMTRPHTEDQRVRALIEEEVAKRVSLMPGVDAEIPKPSKEPTTQELLAQIVDLQRSLAETEDRVAALHSRRRPRAAEPKPSARRKRSGPKDPS